MARTNNLLATHEEQATRAIVISLLIDDTFFNNVIVMVVNPVQTKLFPLTSCRREKKGKGGRASEGPILYFKTPLMTYDTVTKITQDHVLNVSNQDIV